jgi:predicted nucleotidyltransferase
LSRIYWKNKLKLLTEHIEKTAVNPLIILFGSLSKGEATSLSDIDIAVIGSKKEINIKEFEKELRREIQIFYFESFNRINEELKNNILNGNILTGRIKI